MDSAKHSSFVKKGGCGHTFAYKIRHSIYIVYTIRSPFKCKIFKKVKSQFSQVLLNLTAPPPQVPFSNPSEGGWYILYVHIHIEYIYSTHTHIRTQSCLNWEDEDSPRLKIYSSFNKSDCCLGRILYLMALSVAWKQ